MMMLRTLVSIGLMTLALGACGDDSDSSADSKCDKQACMDCIDAASADKGPGTSAPICETECDACTADEETEPTKESSACGDSEGSAACQPPR